MNEISRIVEEITIDKVTMYLTRESNISKIVNENVSKIMNSKSAIEFQIKMYNFTRKC